MLLEMFVLKMVYFEAMAARTVQEVPSEHFLLKNVCSLRGPYLHGLYGQVEVTSLAESEKASGVVHVDVKSFVRELSQGIML